MLGCRSQCSCFIETPQDLRECRKILFNDLKYLIDKSCYTKSNRNPFAEKYVK